MIRRHGVVDPFDVHVPDIHQARGGKTGKGSPNQYALHLQIQAEYSHRAVFLQVLQLISVRQGREGQSAAVSGLSLDGWNDNRESVLTQVGDEG